MKGQNRVAGLPRRLDVKWIGAGCAVLLIGGAIAFAVLDRATTKPPPVVPEPVATTSPVAAVPEPAPAEDGHLAASVTIGRQSGAMSKDRRDAWVRQCIRGGDCKQWQLDAMVTGAPAAEQVHTEALSRAVTAEVIAERFRDGDRVSDTAGLGTILSLVERSGFAMLDLLKPARVLEAKKDSDGCRGKLVKATGSVIDIRKISGMFEGNLMTDEGAIVHFITSTSTTGILDGSRATFRGVYLQEYDFQNVGGGQTRSLLVAGSFDIAANR